jgi:hypothetical protein
MWRTVTESKIADFESVECDQEADGRFTTDTPMIPAEEFNWN